MSYKASDNDTYVTSWQSRGKSNIKIKPPISLNHKFSPIIYFDSLQESISFDGGYLKTDTTIYPALNLPIHIYFVVSLDVLDTTTTLDSKICLANSIYGMMSYTKNGKTDPNEYTYSGHGVSFGSNKYTNSDGEDAYDLIIFGVDMSDSKHVEKKKKNLDIGQKCPKNKQHNNSTRG